MQVKVKLTFNEEDSYKLVRLSERLNLTPKQYINEYLVKELQAEFNSEFLNKEYTRWKEVNEEVERKLKEEVIL